MVRTLLGLWKSPRYAWIRLSALLAFGTLCFVFAAWLWHRGRTWPERAVLPLSNPLANLNQVGVNVDLDQYDASELERVLTQLEEGGFRWVRQRFPWNEIERERDLFEWAIWDAIVSACATHDLKLIAVLDGSPPWARRDSASSSPSAPPQEIADWGAFVARFAERYRGQISAYQVWDEPNLTDHWGNQYVDPAAYTTLLREGAIRIRDADPGSTILLAALAPTIESGPLNLNEIAFLREVGEAGGAPFFDVVALQPYGFGHPPEARADSMWLDFRRVQLVRREMVRVGLGDRPVWATAWGWNHLPADWSGQPSLWPVVSAEHQAEYTLDALQIARREWPWMGPMILYTYQPDRSPHDPRWGFALVDARGDAGLLYDKLVTHNAASPSFHTGTFVPSKDNAHYIGHWRFSKAGADPPRGADAAQRNAAVEFDFVGTSLDLTVRRGDYLGFLYVTVDGRAVNGLPRDEAGRTYLVLYDPSGQVETVNVARRLSPHRSHHVEIVADGGWGQWPLVEWTVLGSQAQAPALGAGTIGLLIAMGLSAVLAVVGRGTLHPYVIGPVYTFVERVFRHYRALPEWIPVLTTLGTALVFYFAPWATLSLPLLVVLFILFFLRIDLGLAVVAFALPFYLKPKALLGRPISTVELGVWLCFLAWLVARLLDVGRAEMRSGPQPLIRRLQRADRNLRELPARIWREWTVLDKGMAALVFMAALSLSWTVYRRVAIHEFRVVFLESALLYALIRRAARSPRAHQRIIEGWLLGAVVISLIGIGQLSAGRNLITADGVSRVRGFYGSPNNLALYLGRALPMFLAFSWRGSNRDRSDRLRRIVFAIGALPVLAGLMFTLSKGALLLGLPTAPLALGWAQRDRRALWTALGTLIIVALLLIPFAFTERFRMLFVPTSGSGFFRLKLWRSTLTMIADHPLTGVGLDNFLYFYRSRYVLPSAWGELNLSHPHNLLLDTWTRLGIGGVVAMAWLLVAFFSVAWRQLRTARGNRRTLLLGLFAAMAATLAHGLVDHAVFLIDLAFVFGLLLAMANPPR